VTITIILIMKGTLEEIPKGVQILTLVEEHIPMMNAVILVLPIEVGHILLEDQTSKTPVLINAKAVEIAAVPPKDM
jgi:hypothetical protein